jgi:hypothetical protein
LKAGFPQFRDGSVVAVVLWFYGRKMDLSERV